MLLGLLHAPPGQGARRPAVRVARAHRRAGRRAGARLRRPHGGPATRMLRLPLASLAFPAAAAPAAAGAAALHGHGASRWCTPTARSACSNTAWAGCCRPRCPSRWIRRAPGCPAGNAWLMQRPRRSLCSRVVAQAGHQNPADAQRAYVAGLARVFPRLSSPYAPPANTLAALDDVLAAARCAAAAGQGIADRRTGRRDQPRWLRHGRRSRSCCAPSARRCIARCRRCSSAPSRARPEGAGSAWPRQDQTRPVA